MPYVIGEPCIDIMDTACTEECPVDCIYEGARKLYINPKECIDCGACEPVCPVEAITQDRATKPEQAEHIEDSARFFNDTLSGRDAPIGNPGGAHSVGKIGVDTELVAGHAGNA